MTIINKYEKIINEFINTSFPELKGKNPKIFEFTILSGYAFYLPILNLIGINKKCRKFSDKEKKGLLIHEICHAKQSNGERFFGNILLFIIYWLSKKFRKKIEIQADKIAIKKGYAKELFESTKRFESEFGKIKYGFSQGQIKSYAKKIKR